MAHAHNNGHAAEHQEHGDSLATYLIVFAALMVLLIVTVWVSFHHFGVFNPIITMAIATVKALLVVIYFMHLRHSRHLVWVFAGGSFFFLAILISAVLSDVYTRNWRDSSGREITHMEMLPGPFEQLMQDPGPLQENNDVPGTREGK